MNAGGDGAWDSQRDIAPLLGWVSLTYPASNSPLCRILPLPELLKCLLCPTVPRGNPETSHCEVRKSVRDSSGVPRTLEVVTVVKGVARAQGAVDDFTKRLTEEEKKSGIFFCWEYTSGRIGRE
jgi:hypothetical protein